MKYAVWPDTALSQIPRNCEELHLVRPAGLRKIQEWISKRSISRISCSPSTAQRLKPKTKNWLSARGILLLVNAQPGRPLSGSLQQMLSVAELTRDHRSFREIQSTTQIPKSTAHYWVKYAKRSKIRSGGKTLFLQ